MAFIDVSQNLQYKKFALWDKEDFIIGTFTQLKNAGEYKGNTQWQAVLDVVDCPFDDYKGNPIEKDSKFGLPLSTALADYFTEDCIGNLFKVIYKGKVPNKSGDNSYHSFKVLMDDSDNSFKVPRDDSKAEKTKAVENSGSTTEEDFDL